MFAIMIIALLHRLAGGFAFQRMSTYGLPCILEVMPMGKYREGNAKLFEILSIVSSLIRTVISLIRLIWDMSKDRKQKSNRPDQG